VYRTEMCCVATIRRRSLRIEDADLLICVDHAERGVGNMSVGIQAHRHSEVRGAVLVVAVEEVSVVEVDVRAGRFRDRNRGLMDREVVVAAQHSMRP
jgi:hypothetical protein